MGVLGTCKSLFRDTPDLGLSFLCWSGGRTLRAGALLLGLLSTLFAGIGVSAAATSGLRSPARFPSSSVTGAPPAGGSEYGVSTSGIAAQRPVVSQLNVPSTATAARPPAHEGSATSIAASPTRTTMPAIS